MLEEWAAEKRIQQSEIYKGLNPDLEKVLLAEIAYNSFVNDQLFFTQQELVEQIKAFLADTVDQPKYLDGKAVLDAITIQQGILVERAEGIFSFSHLTLHEYLTAYHVAQQPDQMQALVEEHLTDDRWREVFLLVAGSLSNATPLLESMAAKTPTLLVMEKLKALVNWADSATAGSLGDYKPAAKRAAALDLDLALALYHFRSRSLYLSLDRSLYLFLDHSLDRSLTFYLHSFLDRSLYLDPSSYLDLDLDRPLEFKKIKIFNQVDFIGLAARLKGLQARIPEGYLSKEIYQKFATQLVQIWCGALHLQPEWLELSEQEATSLERYLYANLLIVQCKEAAVRVSRESWAGIEQRMLTVEDGKKTPVVGAGLAEI